MMIKKLFYALFFFYVNVVLAVESGENKMNDYSQIVCTYSKIKEGCVDNVKKWLYVLEHERRDEILKSFKNEGIFFETAFINEENGKYFLVYFMKANDVTKAVEIFQNSKLSIDDFHKECWEKYTEDHKVLTPIFYLDDLKH